MPVNRSRQTRAGVARSEQEFDGLQYDEIACGLNYGVPDAANELQREAPA